FTIHPAPMSPDKPSRRPHVPSSINNVKEPTPFGGQSFFLENASEGECPINGGDRAISASFKAASRPVKSPLRTPIESVNSLFETFVTECRFCSLAVCKGQWLRPFSASDRHGHLP
ncbi:hypothetical protein, partial [Sphingobium sp.]|uniref:hypothetical protein n=1 Tax=Sphingobium sp. TaxID=1912891 RepID=UPI0025E94677